MKPLLKTTLTTAIAIAALSTSAHAGFELFAKKGFGAGAPSSKHMPPAGYSNQWWTHPSGCEYSKAGRPGEVVWYVIINSIGNRNCPGMIVQRARADFNN
ncbi:hypothetical protein [Amylibacter sp. IMCC11727]|uniref:hypothetical protein n=1 Tax=Amylibacter sp. IMCC11727 TaxID=3039851 RepID=UPI00244DBC44|nr:hypothetical protein [Amylibacter sp. IMCC11727]WGI22558.1 hypothetical protein QBD29_03815 [Amylibacter sp. IMCC11727]